MKTSNSIRRRKAAAKLVSVMYWTVAGSMILAGATGAFLLVAMFLFPFLPFIGFVLVMQGAGAFGERDRFGRENVPSTARNAKRESDAAAVVVGEANLSRYERASPESTPAREPTLALSSSSG